MTAPPAHAPTADSVSSLQSWRCSVTSMRGDGSAVVMRCAQRGASRRGERCDHIRTERLCQLWALGVASHEVV